MSAGRRERCLCCNNWRGAMNNRLLILHLGSGRAAVLGKTGLLALAMTLAPLALTTHGVVRGQAYAASDLPGTDDPATETGTGAKDSVDTGDATDTTHTSGTGTDSADSNDEGGGTGGTGASGTKGSVGGGGDDGGSRGSGGSGGDGGNGGGDGGKGGGD